MFWKCGGKVTFFSRVHNSLFWELDFCLLSVQFY